MKEKTLVVALTAASLFIAGLYGDSSKKSVELINKSGNCEGGSCAAQVNSDEYRNLVNNTLQDNYVAEGHVGPYQELVNSQQPVDKIPAGYNHPAEIDVNGCCDIFVTAAYTLWDVQQDGMRIGSTYSSPAGSFNDTLFMKDAYKSGFKVGIGANTRNDDWVVAANYTWFHHALNRHQGSFPFLSTPFVLIGGGGGGVVFTNSDHRWSFGIDILDVEMGRPFYQGRKLTVNPFFGLRTQWLSQRYKISGQTTLGATSQPTWKTSSWGIGPRFGFDLNFLLGEGFRLIGSASGSLIYTHYSTLSYKEPTASPAYSISFGSKNYLRGDADGKLGFGWGSYLGNKKYFLDFTATYDFQVFWNQNMITWMMNNISNVDASPGNLYLNGLTISGRWDF
ncbi:MAG: hypothetical protein LVR00_03685 [Rhabdochlamydiaceae bacterium]|jgi:hypothetical protein